MDDGGFFGGGYGILVWWWMTREVDLVVKPGMKVVVEIEAVSLHKWTNLDKKVQSVHLK